MHDLLWKSITHSESRVETANVLCHPWRLCLPLLYAEAMALWFLISCRLGKAVSPVRLPILDRPIGLPIWGLLCHPWLDNPVVKFTSSGKCPQGSENLSDIHFHVVCGL